MTDTWSERDFNRRTYTVEGADLDRAKKITVTIHVDGRQLAELQAREPGILAIVSRPDAQGFDIEIVEPGGARFIDHRWPEGQRTSALEEWHRSALGIAP